MVAYGDRLSFPLGNAWLQNMELMVALMLFNLDIRDSV